MRKNDSMQYSILVEILNYELFKVQTLGQKEIRIAFANVKELQIQNSTFRYMQL